MSNKYTSVSATQKNSGGSVQVEARLCIWECDYCLLVVMSRAARILNVWLPAYVPKMCKGPTPDTCAIFIVISGPGSLDFWAWLDLSLTCFLRLVAHLFQSPLVLSVRKRSRCLWPYQFLWEEEEWRNTDKKQPRTCKPVSEEAKRTLAPALLCS